jgi:ERCC4-type nuclease
MIRLDNRVGSGDLSVFFEKWHVPYTLCRLEYGDCAIKGNGPNGTTIEVGVEIKKVRDALNSICDGRFAGHQLPGLIESYHCVWLVLEGQFSCDYESGMLMFRKGRTMAPLTLGQRKFMFRDLDHWLTTMEARGGVRVRRTLSRMETARYIADLHSWWTGKEWEEHRSHLAFDEATVDSEILFRPNLVRRMAAELPGVGWTRSKAVAARFGSVVEMVLANREEWEECDGIGKGIAEKVTKALMGSD